MFFLIFGSSGSGKTECLRHLPPLLPQVVRHDFDSIGVPPNPTKAWRQESNERWVQEALVYEAEGRHMLLCGQSPLGEVLAAPSSHKLKGIAACLLDCSDDVRVQRLRKRGLPEPYDDLLHWAAWMRGHAADPNYRPEVLLEGGAPGLAWERWQSLRKGDPRWQVFVLDTSLLSPEEVAGRIAAWVKDQIHDRDL